MKRALGTRHRPLEKNLRRALQRQCTGGHVTDFKCGAGVSDVRKEESRVKQEKRRGGELSVRIGGVRGNSVPLAGEIRNQS
jgi:hypothetical protein